MNNKYKRLMKEPRIIIALIVILVSIIAMKPTLSMSEDGTYSIKTSIKTGLDLSGGVRVLLSLENSSPEMADEVIKILSSRISSYGLKEMVLRKVNVGDKVYVQLELAGSNETELKNLIEKQGVFKAYVDINVSLKNGSGVLRLNGKEYELNVKNGSVIFNGSVVDDRFSVEDVEFKIVNITDDKLMLYALALTGKDILHIDESAQGSTVSGRGNEWKFEFRVTISKEASDRFTRIIKDIPLDPNSGGRYIVSNINMYLDDKLIDSLRIGSGLKAGATNIVISGPGNSEEDALRSMNTLKSILTSGSLPTKIKVEQISEVSPTLSQSFVRVAVVSIIMAILVVAVVLWIRYRQTKLVLPMVLTSISEVLIIFGFAALVKWTIDLPSIAGIVAAIGSGVDDQIVILDESTQKKTINLKQRLKRAFFIIFASAATTGGAMLPLLSVGAGNVKGFAFTTIVGVLIGVLITRPTFSKIVEYIND